MSQLTYAEPAPFCECFIGSSIIVGIEELLEPLEELEVVLEPALHQPVHGNDLK